MPKVRRRQNPAPDPAERIWQLCHEPATWPGVSTDDLKLMLFSLFSIIHYEGRVTNDDEVSRMRALYLVARERLSRDERIEVLVAIYHAIERGNTSVSALFPFIHAETDSVIIATAARRMASIYPLIDDDPLTGPKFLLQIAGSMESGERRVGVLTGLLLLGDRRMLPILEQAWGFLDEEDREELCCANAGFVTVALVDFLIARLEELDDEEDDSLFCTVIERLRSLPSHAEESIVRDIERKLPVNAPDDRPEIRVLREWTVKEYGRVIAPRLYAIMAREHDPKLVPTVLWAWGMPQTEKQTGDESEASDVIEIILSPRSTGRLNGDSDNAGTEDEGYTIGDMSLEDIAAEREKGWWLDLQDERIDGSPVDSTADNVTRREDLIREAMPTIEEYAAEHGLMIRFEHAITGLLFSVKSIYVMPSDEECARANTLARKLAEALAFEDYTVFRLTP